MSGRLNPTLVRRTIYASVRTVGLERTARLLRLRQDEKLLEWYLTGEVGHKMQARMAGLCRVVGLKDLGRRWRSAEAFDEDTGG